MTQIAAICIALLKGDVLTIGSGFNRLHCTNLPRELSRSIEQKFGVEISKDKTAFKSIYNGKPGYYFRYRLNQTEYNIPGIELMKKYVEDNGGQITSRNPVGRPRNIQTPTPTEEKLF